MQLAGQPAPLFQRCGLSSLLTQAGILDGQRHLVGNAHGQTEVFFRELARRWIIDGDGAIVPAVDNKRHRQDRWVLPEQSLDQASLWLRGYFVLRREEDSLCQVRYDDRLACGQGSASDALAEAQGHARDIVRFQATGCLDSEQAVLEPQDRGRVAAEQTASLGGDKVQGLL